MPRRRLDDQPQHVVVRVRVAPTRPRSEVRLVSCRDGDDLARRPVSQGIAKGCSDELAVAPEVEETAGVVEQVAHRDPLSVRDDTGKPTLDRVVESELPLADELENHRRDERLRDAPDTEAVAGADRRSRLQPPVAARE